MFNSYLLFLKPFYIFYFHDFLFAFVFFFFFCSAVNRRPGVLSMLGKHSQLNCIPSPVLRFNDNILHRGMHHKTTDQGLAPAAHLHTHRSKQAALVLGLSAPHSSSPQVTAVLTPDVDAFYPPLTFALMQQCSLHSLVLHICIQLMLRDTFRLLQIVSCSFSFTMTEFPLLVCGQDVTYLSTLCFCCGSVFPQEDTVLTR